MAIKVCCYVNTDDAFVAWKPDGPIPGLRGFALIRKRNNTEEIVSTWVGPEGQSAEEGTRKKSTEWPIQKFQWTDYIPVAGDKVQYKVVPMTGSFANLKRRDDLASPWTPVETIGAGASDHIAVYFNRGIVASQWLARRLDPKHLGLTQMRRRLDAVVAKPGDAIRDFLAGPLRERLLYLLCDAKKRKLRVYGVLYELDDPELIAALAALGKRANIVLANGSVKKKGEDQNDEARAALAGKINLYDRMVSPKALGHNKFLVICDKNGTPEIAWTGSTNWTKTGLCTQANNALEVNDRAFAREFYHQFMLLKKAGDEFPEELIEANSQSRKLKIDGTKTTLWFTRTTNLQDLEQACELINGAKKAILFLMFNPGPAGTLLNAIIERGSPQSPHYDPNLYVHGAVNQDPSTTKTPVVGLFDRGEYQKAPFEVTLPAAVSEQLSYWREEILKKNQARAMVHSKVIVLDPFSSHPVVMTGSHNLGPKASQTNDENLVIIENHPKLAAAYASQIMAIYSHYRWRFWMSTNKGKKYLGTHDSDTWQESYFQGAKEREMRFWVGK